MSRTSFADSAFHSNKSGMIFKDGRNNKHNNNNHNNNFDPHVNDTDASHSSVARPKPEFTLTVLSYNALAPTYVKRHLEELYSECDNWDLRWELRRGRVLATILAHNADVVCLQEVEELHFHDFFVPQLSCYGYDGRFKKRTMRIPDGVAIFYKTQRLQLLELRGVEFNKGIPVLDRDNVALIAVFAPISFLSVPEPDRVLRPVFDTVVVATTHLLFNPKRGDVKLAQLAVLLSELDLAARRIDDPLLRTELDPPEGPPLASTYSHVVLCGDLNLEPHSPLYDFIVQGSLDYRSLDRVRAAGDSELGPYPPPPYPFPHQLLPFPLGISGACKRFDVSVPQNAKVLSPGRISHDFGFRSVYHDDDDEEKDPSIDGRGVKEKAGKSKERKRMSTHHDRASSLVDYLFFNESPTMRLIRRSVLPERGSRPKMPNATEGSDHFPVCAQFALGGEFRTLKLAKA